MIRPIGGGSVRLMRATPTTFVMSTTTATPTTTTPTTRTAFASDSVTYGIAVRQSNSNIERNPYLLQKEGFRLPCPARTGLKHLFNAAARTLLAWRENARISRFMGGAATQLQLAQYSLSVHGK